MADKDVLLRYQNEQLVGITILDASTHIPTVQREDQPQKGKIDFWDAYLAFRQRFDLDGLDLDVDEIFANVRDQSTS